MDDEPDCAPVFVKPTSKPLVAEQSVARSKMSRFLASDSESPALLANINEHPGVVIKSSDETVAIKNTLKGWINYKNHGVVNKQ